jgi:hypothetical protein
MQILSNVKCQENSAKDCLSVEVFPKEEWIPLRAPPDSNRGIKKFKSRTKTMETLTGENALHYTLS